jgi:hypothetical protein
MGHEDTAKLPLPLINPSLSEPMRIRMQLVFYQHTVRFTGWYLRYMYKLFTCFDGKNEDQNKHDVEVWNNPTFQKHYQLLKSLIPLSTFRRWEPCFREFVFYNTVGMNLVPFEEDTKNFIANYTIDEEKDIDGKYITIRIYTQLSTKDWKDIKQATDKKLETYEPKGEWKGNNLELIVQVANMRIMNPKSTYDQIAVQLMNDFPDLAEKKSGYTYIEVKHLLRIAKQLNFLW